VVYTGLVGMSLCQNYRTVGRALDLQAGRVHRFNALPV